MERKGKGCGKGREMAEKSYREDRDRNIEIGMKRV